MEGHTYKRDIYTKRYTRRDILTERLTEEIRKNLHTERAYTQRNIHKGTHMGGYTYKGIYMRRNIHIKGHTHIGTYTRRDIRTGRIWRNIHMEGYTYEETYPLKDTKKHTQGNIHSKGHTHGRNTEGRTMEGYTQKDIHGGIYIWRDIHTERPCIPPCVSP